MRTSREVLVTLGAAVVAPSTAAYRFPDGALSDRTLPAAALDDPAGTHIDPDPIRS